MCCSIYDLRVAPETRLIIAEHVLPLACVDEGVHEVTDERQMAEGEKWTLNSLLSHVEGADSTLALAPCFQTWAKQARTHIGWISWYVKDELFLHETSDCAT
jgi:hypothetical protein